MAFKFQAVFFDLFNTILYLDNSRLSRVTLGEKTLYTTSLKLYEALQGEAELGVLYPAFLEEFERSRRIMMDRRRRECREYPCVERFQVLCQSLGIPESRAERMVEIHMGLMLEATYLPDENRRVLDALADHPLVLVSNFDHAPTVHRALRRHELEGRFSSVFISDALGWRKPAREFFRRVLEETAFEPGRCLYVGDDPEADVRGAVRQGFQVAWLREDRAAGEPDPPPRWIIPRLEGVVDLVRS